MAGGGSAGTVTGRPPGAIRRTPRRRGWFGCEDRVAWLIRVNRLYGRDDRLTRANDFAAAFRGGSWPEPVSASQISRWETAATRAGFRVLRRYEELLGLPSNHLVATADWVYRKASNRIGTPVLTRELDPADERVHRRTEQLLEQALSDQLMTGAEWDDLTSHLGTLPAAFLYPGTGWASLAERLLAELLIADGAAWLSRIEAVTRLMGQPRARAAIVAACGGLASDPTNQVIIEPLTILDHTADRDANRHVLDQLARPTSDRALRGALLAGIEKVPRRHFRPVELRRILAAVAELLAVADQHPEVRYLTADLLRVVPAGRTGAAYERLRRAIDRTTQSILTCGQMVLPDPAAYTVDRVLGSAMARLPRQPRTSTDAVLSGLLRELLFNPNQNERIVAAQLISATPYRYPVADALARELTSAVRANDVSLAIAILTAMPFVGRPDDRSTVERLVVSPGVPAPVADAAAWRVGHVSGQSDGRFWTTALDTHRTAWQRTRSPASLSSLRGLTYSLGIGRDQVTLDAVRADTRMPPAVRVAAGWWLGIPSRISASAAQ
jgi:hypothetical protein